MEFIIIRITLAGYGGGGGINSYEGIRTFTHKTKSIVDYFYYVIKTKYTPLNIL